MAKLEHYYTRLEENKFYHIYNRAVDRKPMFKNEGNYEYFLKKYDKYLSPVLETHAFSLLRAHFHLVIRVPDLTTFRKLSNLNHDHPAHDIISDKLRKFFQSYALAFNKQQSRIGTLFQTPFKRALVENDYQLKDLIYKLHVSPQLHELKNDFKDWKWSSYNRILNDNPSKLHKKEVLDLYGGKEEFIKYHSERHKMIAAEEYFLKHKNIKD